MLVLRSATQCLVPGRTISRSFPCHPLWTQCWWAISGPQDTSKTSTRICLSSQRSSTSKLSTSGAYNLTWTAWSPRLSDKVRCSHVFMTAMNDEAAAEERREAALGFVEEPSEESGSGGKFVCCSLSFPGLTTFLQHSTIIEAPSCCHSVMETYNKLYRFSQIIAFSQSSSARRG